MSMAMVTQIHAVPDKDGIIRVACGGDSIEIHVHPRTTIAEIDGLPLPVKMPDPKPHRRSRGIKIIDIPIKTFATEGDDNYDKIDVDYVIERLSFQLEKNSNAELINLSVGEGMAMDIHDLAKLSSSMAQNLPGVGISVDFGLDSDDE